MSAPDDRKYLASHEWHKTEGDLIVIGISQVAVDELTDITYLEVTTESGEIGSGETFGEIESVKATSELYTGVAGEVVEVNQEALDNPAIINDDCYGAGWIIKIKPSDAAATDALLSADDYQAQQAD
ncbi:MAG: glycine cleavage system protein GcvH [Phycisphaeraceae bacterium]